jgi:DNA-binding HxlR family transcriptional regulator
LGIIERVDADRGARNNAFQLTKSGKELRRVLEALGRWTYANIRDLHPEIVSID